MPATTRLATLLALLLGGCAAPVTTPATTPRVQSLGATPELTAVIRAGSPRYPLHSDRFEFATGRFVPRDDGMGPAGDVSFFHDGERFMAIANQGGGVARALASQGAAFSGAPVPLTLGTTLQVRTPEGVRQLLITRLDRGTLQLAPGEIAGEGAVGFRVAAS